jgi:hypothetical protein
MVFDNGPFNVRRILRIGDDNRNTGLSSSESIRVQLEASRGALEAAQQNVAEADAKLLDTAVMVDLEKVEYFEEWKAAESRIARVAAAQIAALELALAQAEKRERAEAARAKIADFSKGLRKKHSAARKALSDAEAAVEIARSALIAVEDEHTALTREATEAEVEPPTPLVEIAGANVTSGRYATLRERAADQAWLIEVGSRATLATPGALPQWLVK